MIGEVENYYREKVMWWKGYGSKIEIGAWSY